MPTLEVKDPVLDLTLVSDRKLSDESVPFRGLYEALESWARVGGIKQITFIQDGGDPFLFVWRSERVDLTVLDSTFQFDSETDLNPGLTISLVQAWPYGVIIGGEATRRRLIRLRADYGLTWFSVSFF